MSSTPASITETSAACTQCGCTWTSPCSEGCAWDHAFWRRGQALCTACSAKLGPVCGGCDRPIAAVIEHVPPSPLKYRLLGDGHQFGWCRCRPPKPNPVLAPLADALGGPG